MLCLLKNCRKCSGDLILDGDEWRCWQCGQYYYPMNESPDMLEEPPNPEIVAAREFLAKQEPGFDAHLGT